LDADTKCVSSSGAFIEEEGASTDHFWVGIAVGFAVCAVMAMAVGIVIFARISRKRTQGTSPGNERDTVKLTDDQQLDTAGATTIELNESIDLHATVPMDDTV